MLPPSDDSDFPEYDPDDDRFEDFATYKAVKEGIEFYMHDQGFSNEQWFDMITHIENFSDYVDDEGEFHAEFDVDWSSEDGEYSGSYHVSY